jgi:hypothetical protein
LHAEASTPSCTATHHWALRCPSAFHSIDHIEGKNELTLSANLASASTFSLGSTCLPFCRRVPAVPALRHVAVSLTTHAGRSTHTIVYCSAKKKKKKNYESSISKWHTCTPANRKRGARGIRSYRDKEIVLNDSSEGVHAVLVVVRAHGSSRQELIGGSDHSTTKSQNRTERGTLGTQGTLNDCPDNLFQTK